MPLEVDCTCGQRFPVSEALAGLSVRCRECGRAVAVPRPGGSSPPPPPAKPQAASQVATPLAAALPPPAPPPPPAAPSAADLKKSSGSYDPSAANPEPQQEEGTFSGGMIGGLGMILVAVIWLVVGLALGWLFYYPIIMFFIGVGTLIKALLNNE